jgi:hypothetical protein
MFEEMAKERQKEAGGDHKAVKANSPQAESGQSRAQAAKAVNVGERIVQDAQFVRDIRQICRMFQTCQTFTT